MFKYRVVAGTAVILCLVAFVAIQASQSVAEKEVTSREEISKAQLELVDETLKFYGLLDKRPVPPGGDGVSHLQLDKYIIWSRRAVDVRAEMGDRKEWLTALDAHRDRMKEIVGFLERLVAAERLSRIGLADAKYELLQAEFELAKAQGKQ